MHNKTKTDEHKPRAPRSRIAAALLAVCVVSLMILGASRPYAQSALPTTRNVVLVHGAFADGSSYSRVIPLLEAKGLHVTAVQNPLTSLADDVAATKRAIANQNGPVILVGHS